MVTRRSIRRLLPVVCAVLLVRIYVIRLQEGHGEDDDSALHSWHESTSNEVKSEMEVLHGPSETPQSSVVTETRRWIFYWGRRISEPSEAVSGIPGHPYPKARGARARDHEVQEGAHAAWSGFKVSSWVKDNVLNCSCLLWYTDTNVPSQGTLKAFVYEEGLKVYEKIPYAVSIIPKDCQNSSYSLIYLRREEETANASENSSAVCVRPLFGPYNDLVGMAQFISYYSSVLNVNYFYFYDLALNDDVREYLSKVATLGVKINILYWNVPTTDWEKLWDLGSLTALNDCVYRSSKKHTYVAVVDLDEFIVPKMKGLTLEDIYKKVISHKVGNHGDAALIRNVFFCYEFENTKNNATDANELPIFRYIHREDRIWPSKLRSKMIVVPEAVVALGHHMIHHFAKGNLKNHGAPNTIAVMRHYRTCKEVNMGTHATGPRVLDQKTVKDASMMKFRSSILKSRVLQLYLQFIQNKMKSNRIL
nr:uncharacterized protein LOC113830126 [Penaeus vannamei]